MKAGFRDEIPTRHVRFSAMTTIVATLDSIWADRKVSGGPMYKTTKIQKINGSLYGGAGTLEQILKMFLWFSNPDMKPEWKFEPEFSILQVSVAGGIFYWGSEMIAVPISLPFYSVGSGSEFAIGALECGAPPDQAIKIAAKYDPYTGTEVQRHKL
jgi:hypothetical protein